MYYVTFYCQQHILIGTASVGHFYAFVDAMSLFESLSSTDHFKFNYLLHTFQTKQLL